MCSALVWDCYAEMSSVSTSNSLAANKHHATTSLLNLLLKYRVWFANSNVFKASKLPGTLWKVNWVEARAERHFQKQKAAPVSAQHLMRGSGDVRAFCIERGYVLTFDEASLSHVQSVRGLQSTTGKEGKVSNGEQSNVQLLGKRTFPGKKFQGVVLWRTWGSFPDNAPMSSLSLWS